MKEEKTREVKQKTSTAKKMKQREIILSDVSSSVSLSTGCEGECKDLYEDASGSSSELDGRAAPLQLFAVNKSEEEQPATIQSLSIQAVEWKHQQELEALEEAIEKKRGELQARIEVEHMKEKSALEDKLQQLDHEILAQQYKFQQCEDRIEQAIQKLENDYERTVVAHDKQMDTLEQTGRSGTDDSVAKIELVRGDYEKLTPEIARMDGKLQTARRTAYNASEAASIQRGVMEDIQEKMKVNTEDFEKEERNMEEDAKEQDVVLADALENLEQELQDTRRQLNRLREPYEKRLNEIRKQIQKIQTSPGQLDLERKKLKSEVRRLKEQWKGLRGNEEDQLEATINTKDTKALQGRERLLNQRNAFFNDRTRLADSIADFDSRIFEKQKDIDQAKETFEDRMKAKQKEMADAEEAHTNKVNERIERRQKRIEEIELLEQEKEKRRNMELNLLSTREDKLKESFDIKKSHIQDAIEEGNKRIKDLLEDLGNPMDKQLVHLQDLQRELVEVKQRRDFLSNMEKFTKSVGEREIGLIQQEGQNLKKYYSDQSSGKQKELNSLKESDAKMDREMEKQNALGEERFNKATAKLNNLTDKMQKYLENLTNEVKRLERKRFLFLDEYKAQQEGIRDVIAKDETFLETEREKLHSEMEKERAEFNDAVADYNEKIENARAHRDDMTAKFNQDIGQFTIKAMGAGGSLQSYSKLLTNLEDKIQFYSKQVEEMNEKLEELLKDQKEEVGMALKEKRQTIVQLQKTCQDLEQKLRDKQKLIKDGNRALKLYANEDNCLYCRESNQIKGQKEQLSNLHEDNRRITARITTLFKLEKEYERCSSEEVGQLRSCLQATSTANEEAVEKEEKELNEKLSSLQDENAKLRQEATSLRMRKDHSHFR